MSLSAEITPSIAEAFARHCGGKKAHGSGDQWYTCCPVHGDTNPSMSVKYDIKNGKGRLIVFCQAGCDWKEILAVGENAGVIPKWQPEGRLNKKQYVWEKIKGFRIVDEYDYVDENHVLLYQCVRMLLPDGDKTFGQCVPDGKGDWILKLGDVRRVPLYLPEVIETAKNGGEIIIHEGEKDAKRCRQDGITASTNVTGALKWRAEYCQYFRGAKNYLVVDNDWKGYEHANQVGSFFKEDGQELYIIILPGIQHKGDYSDFREDFEVDIFRELMNDAFPWEKPIVNPWPKPPPKNKKEQTSEPRQQQQEETASPNGKVVKLYEAKLPSLEVIQCFTDAGNAYRFEEAFKGKVVYTKARGWAIWDGKRWIWDEKDYVRELAKQVGRDILNEAALHPPEKLAKWAIHSLQDEGVSRTLKSARSLPGIAAHIDDFDADPYIVNFQNCIVNMVTGEILDHDSKYLCSQICDTELDVDAFEQFACEGLSRQDSLVVYERLMPHWFDSLSWICSTDLDKFYFLQEAGGYLYTGSTSEQAAFLCEGEGQNLKSTWIDTKHDMLGSYAHTVQASMFMKGHMESPQDNMSQLLKIRLAAVQEVDAGDRLNEAKLKTFTGKSDWLSGRFMTHNAFKFKNTAKAVFRCNHMPKIVNQDKGIRRRLVAIPFTNQIPDDQLDRNFETYIRKEWPIIAAFDIRGGMNMVKRGRLVYPDCVKAQSENYLNSQDSFGAFLNNCFIKDEEGKVHSKVFQQVYAAYSKLYRVEQLGAQRLGIELKRRGVQNDHVETGRFYKGIKVHPDWDSSSGESSKSRYLSRSADYDDN